MSRRPAPLAPGRASRTLAHRLAAKVDRVRQVATRLGVRPYRVFLVWTRWTGEEEGEGERVRVLEHEILPTPLVSDLSSIALSPMSAGALPVGSLRVTEVSALLTADVLKGLRKPSAAGASEPEIGDDEDFFYEVVEDDRSGASVERRKMRLAADPFLDAQNVQWILLLERRGADDDRSGRAALDGAAVIDGELVED